MFCLFNLGCWFFPPSFLTYQQQQKAGVSGDVQEFGPDGKAITKTKFSMDTALEDKICDLYDLFVDVRISAINTLRILFVYENLPYWTLFAIAVGVGWKCRSTNQKAVCWGD